MSVSNYLACHRQLRRTCMPTASTVGFAASVEVLRRWLMQPLFHISKIKIINHWDQPNDWGLHHLDLDQFEERRRGEGGESGPSSIKECLPPRYLRLPSRHNNSTLWTRGTTSQPIILSLTVPDSFTMDSNCTNSSKKMRWARSYFLMLA